MSSSTAADFVKRAVDLRVAGRLDEALLAARRATSLDAEDANGWWQLALTTWERDGPAAAIPHLRKTVQIADGFSHGWHRLGKAYKVSAMLDKAVECWEQAVEADNENVESISALVEAYGQRELAGDDEKRFEMLKVLEELGRVEGGHWNTLGIGYYNRKEHQRAIRCYRRYAMENGGHVAYFNLGLALNSPEVQQRTDAIDAWRKALAIEPGYEKGLTSLSAAVPKAVELSRRVISGRRIFLSEEEWYANYVNPYELLQLIEESGNEFHELDAKTLQKAKKRLLQEIELEEGVVEWMPGLRIDRSRAIKIADELSTEQNVYPHWIVAMSRELCAFLSRGDIKFFLVAAEIRTYEDRLPDLGDFEDHEAVSWIGERFAPQFDLVLSKALEAKDLNAIEALLGGRRLVPPELEDRCFEGAQRHVTRMLEPLRAAAKRAQETKPSVAGMRALLERDHVGRIVMLLPQYFQSVHNEVANLIRSVSISAHNKHGDTDLAKELLAIGRSLAARSPALLHQLQEDEKALDEMLKAQSEHDASLEFKGATYSITRKRVSFGTQVLANEDIRDIWWGVVFSNESGSRTAKFNLEMVDRNEKRAQLTWSTTSGIEKQIELFQKMTNAALHYIMPTVVEQLGQKMESGHLFRIGAAVCNKAGVHFTLKGWWEDRKFVCPWTRLNAEIENGDLVLADPTERKARHELPLASTPNAFALFILINSLQS